MNYAIVGLGKMGRAVDVEATRRGHRRVVAVDPRADETGVRPAIEPRDLGDVEIVFEFTAPTEAERNVRRLLEAGARVVCGTTGWTPSAELRAAAETGSAGAVVAPNFSVGMNLFYRLVATAARLYGAAGLHQPYVWEAHHRAKRDVPSGTARKLAALLLREDPRLTEVLEGNPGRPMADHVLQVASVRAGSETGTHVVGFDGQHDRITLTHAARSRTAFALGAVLAGEWLAGRSGWHGFDEVLLDLVESSGGGPGPGSGGANERRTD